MKINRGLPYALAAYTIWGLFPIYWKALSGISPFEIIAHRIVWSFAFTALLMTLNKGWQDLFSRLRQPKLLAGISASSILIGINWFLYVWGVNTGKVLQCSLGYFMLPLLSVLTGAICLRESLQRTHVIAITFATIGVAILTLDYGAFPWLSLTLAISFTAYSFIRKTIRIESLPGLTVETAVCAIPFLFYLYHLESSNQASFGHANLRTNLLLVGAGILTTLPLLWFTKAARLMNLSSLGILQYLGPTLQFLLGVVVFHEAFNTTRLIAFCIIWIGLIIYSWGMIQAFRRDRSI